MSDALGSNIDITNRKYEDKTVQTKDEEKDNCDQPAKDEKTDQHVHHEETENAYKANPESVTEEKDGDTEQHIQHEEAEEAYKTEPGSVTEANMKEKDGDTEQHVQHEEAEDAYKTEPGSVTEANIKTSDEEKGHYVQCEETEAANNAEPESDRKRKYLEKDVQHKETEAANKAKPVTVTNGMKGSTSMKKAGRHAKCCPPSQRQVLKYNEHLIKLISEQQKQQQDKQCHIVHQLLEIQKENMQLLMNLKEDQQLHQNHHHALLLEFKEHQNLQLQFFTDFLQEIKNLIQQQNNFISGQLQQQQQDFQAKLMEDLAKQTEKQVTVMLKTFSKYETSQTSYNKEYPSEKSRFSFGADPPNSSSSHTMSSGFSQDEIKLNWESSGNFEAQNRNMQRRELFHCEPVGEVFCNEFYPLWNSQNPSYEQKGTILWGRHLFWENVTLEMINYENGPHELQRYEGFECVNDGLLNLTNHKGLTFRPSIDSEHFKCVNSKHGLVVVAVTGTIFRKECFIGIFEQSFGLVQCPETQNLKIKFTNLKTKYFNHMPDSIDAPTLTYTTEQLENM